MKKKIKIGLLINPNRKFYEWEINLINSIKKSNYCQIKAILHEPKPNKNESNLKKFFNVFFKKNIFNSFLHFLIKLVENKFSSNLYTKDNLFKHIRTVKIYSKRSSGREY